MIAFRDQLGLVAVRPLPSSSFFASNGFEFVNSVRVKVITGAKGSSMKIVWAVALLLVTTPGLYARPSTWIGTKEEVPALRVVCAVGKIDLVSSSDSEYLDIGLRCTAENKSAAPIIFLQPVPTVLSAEIVNPGRPARTAARGYFMTSSFGLDENGWNLIVRDLDRPTPPEGKTYSLAPGAAMPFGETIRLTIESINEVVIYGGPKDDRTLAAWKDVLPLELNVSFETWSILPLVVNNKYAGSRQKDFGRKLRRHWKKAGYLWLDAIQAEPLPIDLKDAVGK
jgi:hypothetical protein